MLVTIGLLLYARYAFTDLYLYSNKGELALFVLVAMAARLRVLD